MLAIADVTVTRHDIIASPGIQRRESRPGLALAE